MKKTTAAAESSKIPKNLNGIEDKLGKYLSDKQKQSLKVLRDEAGGDKLISPQAAEKFKKEIDKAKETAVSDVEAQASATPLSNSIEKLKQFKASFLEGKAGGAKQLAVKREEAAKAKAIEEEKQRVAKEQQEQQAKQPGGEIPVVDNLSEVAVDPDDDDEESGF